DLLNCLAIAHDFNINITATLWIHPTRTVQVSNDTIIGDTTIITRLIDKSGDHHLHGLGLLEGCIHADIRDINTAYLRFNHRLQIAIANTCHFDRSNIRNKNIALWIDGLSSVKLISPPET